MPNQLEQFFSSENENWETPKYIFDPLNDIFQFQLDAAADQNNTKCKAYITREQNALTTNWHQQLHIVNCGSHWYKHECVFLNPPYGGMVRPFLEKTVEEYRKGLTIIVILAANTETKAFKLVHDYARYVCFPYKRIKFELNGEPLGSSTFSPAIAIFTDHYWDLTPLEPLMKIYNNNVKT